MAEEEAGAEFTLLAQVERAELLERLDAARAQLQLLKEEESKHTGLDPSMFAAKGESDFSAEPRMRWSDRR